MGRTSGVMLRTLVICAVFALYLAAPTEPEPQHDFKFGDMISVARGAKKAPLFTHWAIFVGKGKVDGLEEKKDEEDLFHINAANTITLSDCIFGKVGKTNYVKSNYLDKDEKGNGYDVQSRENMIKKINELHHKCSKWSPTKHNCEQVATSIRYGFEHSEQRGTLVEGKFRFRSEKPANNSKRSLSDVLKEDSSLAAAGA
ncbi:phospholipase A and acyltransferase 3-like [Puntigrus tetrazona]|uniref:phospholipase A and acyltransferase 3-like n=1 Tax=Puntigrus tetrazona TaxID=1606681 RepID=UPI001C8AFFC0|nr:phospholipase A and acyltransferase 3-like [Puntigrus tetrazona]